MPAPLRVAAQADPVAAGIVLLHQHLERVVDEVQLLQRESSSLVVLAQRTDVQQIHPWTEDAFTTEDEEAPSPLPGQISEGKGSHSPPTIVVFGPDALDDDRTGKGGHLMTVPAADPLSRSPRPSLVSGESENPIGAWDHQRRMVRKSKGFFIQDLLKHPKLRGAGNGGSTMSRPSGHRVFNQMDAEDVKHAMLDGMISASSARHVGGHFHAPGHLFGDIARSDLFQGLSFSVVLFSSIWLAFEIDADEETTAHIVMAQLFCMYFVIEMFINLLAFKVKAMVLRDMSFMFDLLLVILIVLETWLLPVAYAIAGSDGGGGNMRIVMIFRLLRFLKVLRLAKVIRQLPELVIIIRGIVFAYKAISFTIILIGITIYAGALVFRVLLEDTELGNARFASVPMSFTTLLVEATLSGSKGGILILEATQQHLCYALLILLYVVVANITMMGIVSGLLVQAVKTVTEVEKAESSYSALFENLSHIWKLAISKDSDGDGLIDLAEFEEIIHDEETSRILAKADVDVESLRECSDFMFNQHAAMTGGKLTKKEFMQCVMLHRGKEGAKVKDHIQTRRYVYQQFTTIFQRHERRLSKSSEPWVLDAES